MPALIARRCSRAHERRRALAAIADAADRGPALGTRTRRLRRTPEGTGDREMSLRWRRSASPGADAGQGDGQHVARSFRTRVERSGCRHVPSAGISRSGSSTTRSTRPGRDYREETDGQILQEGINEPARCFLHRGKAAYANHGVQMILYLTRCRLPADRRSRPGRRRHAVSRSARRTAGRPCRQGLQHQDGHSHLPRTPSRAASPTTHLRLQRR